MHKQDKGSQALSTSELHQLNNKLSMYIQYLICICRFWARLHSVTHRQYNPYEEKNKIKSSSYFPIPIPTTTTTHYHYQLPTTTTNFPLPTTTTKPHHALFSLKIGPIMSYFFRVLYLHHSYIIPS
jgi:hypothetical protein